MLFTDQIKAANTADLRNYRPFLIDHKPVGLIQIDQLSLLQEHGLPIINGELGYHLDRVGSADDYTKLLDETVCSLREGGYVPGWRNESYALSSEFNAPALALVERAAMPLFGGCGYGVHVNGLTLKNDELHIWVAQRAWDKPTDPGKLDQIAAGGLPYGVDVLANVQKECAEEAGIPAELSAQARAVSMCSYFYRVDNGIRADQLFNYDLWLPEEFVPHNQDGEVIEFVCLPAIEVMTMVADGNHFKFNANLVLIDCFIRHGLMTPQHAGYEYLCAQLNPRRAMLRYHFEAFR